MRSTFFICNIQNLIPHALKEYYTLMFLTATIIMIVITITLILSIYYFRNKIHITIEAFAETSEYFQLTAEHL
jgi:hypothetical protein